MLSNLLDVALAYAVGLAMTDEISLRINASALFADPVAREWWARQATTWAA